MGSVEAENKSDWQPGPLETQTEIALSGDKDKVYTVLQSVT